MPLATLRPGGAHQHTQKKNQPINVHITWIDTLTCYQTASSQYICNSHHSVMCQMLHSMPASVYCTLERITLYTYT